MVIFLKLPKPVLKTIQSFFSGCKFFLKPQSFSTGFFIVFLYHELDPDIVLLLKLLHLFVVLILSYVPHLHDFLGLLGFLLVLAHNLFVFLLFLDEQVEVPLKSKPHISELFSFKWYFAGKLNQQIA